MNDNQKKAKNLSTLELIEQCKQTLEKDKERYQKNYNHYHNTVINSDIAEANKKQLGSKLNHDYWRSIFYQELIDRLDSDCLLYFLWGLEAAK